MMELSELQKRIVESDAKKMVVIASAAAGKTHTMTEKVRKLLNDGEDPNDIAVITFTNMAADELRKRLGSDYKDGLFVGTIHSLANRMLCMKGISTSKILDDEEFDKLFELIDKNQWCIKHYKWILLDEAQDSDYLQFRFLFTLIDPECFLAVGDPKQSIYGFKGSNPGLMTELTQHPDVETFDLNENYRNGSNILAYAKSLIAPNGMYDTSKAMRAAAGNVIEAPYSTATIINKISYTDEYGDWAILVRTNSEVDKMISLLRSTGIPVDTFKQKDLNNEQLSERLSANTVKVLTIHSSKGLEFKNVIVTGMRYKPFEERNVCYVAATRARDTLIWMGHPRKKPQQKTKYDIVNW